MKIAVTGATGVIGRFVVGYLVSAGHEVTALVRPTSDRSGFAQPPRWIVGDVQDRNVLDDLLEGADALVHSAFDHLPGRYRGGEGDNPTGFWQSNLVGTVGLLEAARRHRLARVVLLSSRAVFGQQPGQLEKSVGPVGDAHPVWPDTHYGALKAAVEALVGVYSAQGLSCTALRSTGVYGLGYPRASSKWFDLAALAWQNAPAPEERIASEVHGIDVANACHLLLVAADDEVSGRSFNCSDVVVSRRGLYQCMQQLAHDGPTPTPAQALIVDPSRASINNLMSCDGLLGMGWQPGGEERLQNTVTALVAAARVGPP